jgi:hypothetical protein
MHNLDKVRYVLLMYLLCILLHGFLLDLHSALYKTT